MTDYYKKRKKLTTEYNNKHFTWLKGRQIGEYEVMILSRTTWLPFDCYLIRYKTGTHIPPHIDKVNSGRHFRLNIILKRAKRGGEYIGNAIFKWWRFVFFRPDIMEHSVSTVEEGTRYVLSIGWKLK